MSERKWIPYWEKLRDPRWQKKRLEIMQRDGWKCAECDATGTTLNVHHSYYAKGRDPWEYEDESLRCLCEDCHERTEHSLAEVRRAIGMLDSHHLAMVQGYVRGMRFMEEGGDETPIRSENAPINVGIAAAFGVDPWDVIDTMKNDGTVDTDRLISIARKRLAQWQVADAIENIDKIWDDAKDGEAQT